jgi:cytochrome b subunit of formate dehydrogenase
MMAARVADEIDIVKRVLDELDRLGASRAIGGFCDSGGDFPLGHQQQFPGSLILIEKQLLPMLRHGVAAHAVAHRLAAMIFIVRVAWHTIYLFFTKSGKSWLRAMVPERKDIADFIQMIRYNLGLADTKQMFDRFCYIEKVEYSALARGTGIMILTGIVLWFKEYFARWIPFRGFEVATTIHFMEAVLATFAILIRHLYFVLFNPDVGPMATQWLTGTMTAEKMHEEHPLEFDKNTKQNSEELPPTD